MAETGQRAFLRNVVNRLDALLADHPEVASIFNRIAHHVGPPVLFGGAVRDLMSSGRGARPRDLDLVVECAGVEDLTDALHASALPMRRTRFGGVRIHAGTLPVDIWPFKDTWAIRKGIVRAGGIHDLPRTTFLNVEAIAVQMGSPRGGPRIFEHGFFSAFESRTVEINLEENPFPETCVVRALVTAKRLGFVVGPRLASFVVRHAQALSHRDLLEIQLGHYGRVVLDANAIGCLVEQCLSRRAHLPAVPK